MNLRNFVGHVFGGVGGLITDVSKRIYGKDMSRWFFDAGDKNLRLDYELDKNSIVFDLGGYEGQWASDIYSRFLCTVFVFEPVKKFAENIEIRFRQNENIRVFAVGLSDSNRTVKISVDNDRSSIYKAGDNYESIQLVDINEFIKNNSIDRIDLMKINIEGGEYDLLDKMISTGLVKNVNYLQIQFHDYFTGASERRQQILKRLAESHDRMWNYEWVWESWKLK